MQKILLLITLMTSLMLVACGGRSAETTFYILDSGESTPMALDNVKNNEQMPTVQLSKVEMPKYLDRSSIVTREPSGVRLHLASFDSWAEPLDSGAKRVINEVLTPQLLKQEVLLLAVDDDAISSMEIFIQIQRFDGTIGQDVLLDARWSLRDDSNDTIASGAFVDKVSAGMDYTSLVKAKSTLLKQLAKSMANPIGAAVNSKN